MQPHRLGNFLRAGLVRRVLEVKHLGLQKRPLLVHLHDLKAFAPLSHDIHAAIGIFSGNGDNLCCAADLSDPLLLGPDDAK